MNIFNSLNRSKLLQKIQKTHYDLVVIGGGATGSGIALDAASRGLKTLLVEKWDFASGTSSKSTKLIHGGLRYLKQFEIALVREVGRERAIVHRLAPHLVVSEKMMLPLIKGGTYGRLSTSLGLMVYDVLAGVESAEQRIMFSKEEAMAHEPLLKEEVVEGAGFYVEYRTDDARLSIEILKTASLYGAESINYVEVTDFVYTEGKITGVSCTDFFSGETFPVQAQQVVNAAGPWVDELRAKNDSLEGKHLFLTKGVHIVLPHDRLPIHQSIYFDVPDGRMIFAIPRGKITYVGTTDTQYFGDKNNPRTNIEDVEYLLDGINNLFPTVNLTPRDVISSWAGLRPLIHESGKSASEISRKDEIFHSPTNLISIAGGKLTGYRKMAERVVDLVAREIGHKQDRNFKKCRTDKISIKGGGFEDPGDVKIYTDRVFDELKEHGGSRYDAVYLVHNYGQQTDIILDHFLEMPHQDEETLIQAEFQFCREYEMVHTAMDFWGRRTGRIYFDIESVRKYGPKLMGDFRSYFGWDEKRLAYERQSLVEALQEAAEFPPRRETENIPDPSPEM